MFSACNYQNKPAVFDSKARVYYFGFRTMAQARKKAQELNEGV